MSSLGELVDELIDQVEDFGDIGLGLSRAKWETKFKAKVAEVFRLGMGVGWDKYHNAHVAPRVEVLPPDPDNHVAGTLHSATYHMGSIAHDHTDCPPSH